MDWASIVNDIMVELFAYLNEWLFNLIMDIVAWCMTSADVIWSDPIMTGLFSFVQWVGMGIFAASLIVMILDVFEDVSADKRAYGSTVFFNVLKGFGFTVAAAPVGRLAMLLAGQLADAFDLTSALDVEEWAAAFAVQPTSSLFLIIVLIACIVFLYNSLKRYGLMMVQIMTFPLYVPGIVRGDTTAMGSWIRQTIAIALTFLFQYILFYLGCLFWMKYSLIAAMGCWIAITSVTRILDKYGLSTGTGGGVSSGVSLAMQGIQLAGAA